MAVDVRVLSWDEQNEAHIAKHGVTPGEVNQVVENPHVIVRNRKNRRARNLMIGRTHGGRALCVALAKTNRPGTWRPVTAYSATEAQIALLDKNSEGDVMAKKRDSESDYEVVGVSKGEKPGAIVSVRLKPDEMELLVALSEVAGRSLSETMRLGLRCLGDSPERATGSSLIDLRLDTHVSEAVSSLPGQPQERSESSPTRVTLVLA